MREVGAPPGREWYIVLEGLVRIELDPATLGVLKPGSTDPHPILTLGPLMLGQANKKDSTR